MRERKSEQIKREVIQHFAFAVFFIAGLFTTDLFMNDYVFRAGSVGSTFNLTRNAKSVTPPADRALAPGALTPNGSVVPAGKSIRNTSYEVLENRPPFGTKLGSRRHAWPTENPRSRLGEDDDAIIWARQLERQRIEVIQKVIPAVVSIFGLEREGGGSGVLIHPSGLALTNHHVIAAAGAEGWGGLADGKLYRWQLVGNDPGGDLALIRLLPEKSEEGEGHKHNASFPYVRMGDSDQVRVGDWTLVIGNPFTLAEDYRPTVTYGIVSGVKRYQPGMGDTMLVYGNCIQVDTSINPGNSGGPLFDMQGDLIGINGRASFEFRERGRVNVGLGYAISVNQCRNFLPELMATKLIQHGTLDAIFGDRDGKVLCTAIYEDADIGKLGLALGDELLEFEGEEIRSANQFTNLICTLPAGWPAALKIRKPDGRMTEIRMRLIGLPYPKMDAPPSRRPPNAPEKPPGSEEKLPDRPPGEEQEKGPDKPDAPPSLQKQIEASRMALFQFMSHAPGEIQNPSVNQSQAQLLWDRWRETWRGDTSIPSNIDRETKFEIVERWSTSEGVVGNWRLQLTLKPAALPNVDVESPENETAPDTAMICHELIAELVETDVDAQHLGWQSLEPNNSILAIRWQESGWSKGSREADGSWSWEEIPEQQVLRTTIGFQVWTLVLAIQPEWVSKQELVLHGVDRLDRDVVSRFQFAAQSHPSPTYLWVQLDDWTQAPASSLLKVDSDINGRRGSGGVRIRDWQENSPIPWPSHRQVVKGLFEDVVVSVSTESIKVLEAQ